MAQQIKIMTVLAEDMGSVPSIQIRWCTAACNTNSKACDASGFCRLHHSLVLPHTQLKIILERKTSSNMHWYGQPRNQELWNILPAHRSCDNSFSASISCSGSFVVYSPEPGSINLCFMYSYTTFKIQTPGDSVSC